VASAKTPPKTPPKPLLKPSLSKEPKSDLQRNTSSLQPTIGSNIFNSPKKTPSQPEYSARKSFLEEMQNKTISSRRSPSMELRSQSLDNRILSDTSESSSGQASPEVPRKQSESYLARTRSSEWASSNNHGSNNSSPPTSIVDKPTPQVLPKPKRPAPVAPHKRTPPVSGTSSILSSSSENSHQSDLNPSELYTMVEKQIKAEGEIAKPSGGGAKPLLRSRPDSTASLTSTDSGIRTSLEIHGRSPNADIPSDFDNSDGDDSLIGRSNNNSMKDPSPQVIFNYL